MAADPAILVPTGGLLIGAAFGAVAARTNFCTMGAVSDIVNMGHWGRMRMWLLAVAVAVAGTAALQWTGLAEVADSLYRRPAIGWLSLLAGGTIFGVGMSLAGGCANKNLVRLGGGSVRSLVVLAFMAISAYMTLKGLFGQWRAGWLDPVRLDLAPRGLKDQGLPALLAVATGLAPRSALALAASAVALALAVFVFKDRRFRANAQQVGGGLALGALVVAGWYLTGHLGHGENPETLETVYFATNTRTLESVSFVAPLAYTLELLMLWTDRSLHASFGIAAAAGVALGSLAVALATRSFRWEGFASVQDLRRQLLGAVLMGFGGVTALGCTVGQGMAGLSTLAAGSLLATAAIVAGSVVTLKWIHWRAEKDA